MRKLVVLFFLLSSGLILSAQTVKGDKIPVTTSSGKALAFYNEAMKHIDNVDMTKARDLLLQSLKEDPGFFMADYQLAFYYGGTGNLGKFLEHARAAADSRAKLSAGEELLRSAIRKLSEDQGADVTDIGKKLVEMYPLDIAAYNNLFYFQSFINDTQGELETLNKALKVATNKAPVYNSLGYVYMNLKRNDEAEAAFDKYIELDPKNPNVYDSKGDFYMNTSNFKKAYESYMKAYSLDTAWSYDKAQKAKQLYEMSEGTKLEIITL